MRQQVLEQKIAEIEALASAALKSGAHVSALLDIIKAAQAAARRA